MSLGLRLGWAVLACAGLSFAPALAVDRGAVPVVSTKVERGIRRRKLAEPSASPRYRRSKNPPHRRPLRANRLHVSRRTWRRHRRGR